MQVLKTAFLAALLAAGLACGYSKSFTPPVAGSTPTVAQLSPASETAGSGDFVLTVNGTNFAADAAVNWAGAPRATSHVSASQLTVNISAADIASAGNVSVTVTNPGKPGGQYGGGTLPETSNAMTFTVN